VADKSVVGETGGRRIYARSLCDMECLCPCCCLCAKDAVALLMKANRPICSLGFGTPPCLLGVDLLLGAGAGLDLIFHGCAFSATGMHSVRTPPL
jgi:hypothetical protein